MTPADRISAIEARVSLLETALTSFLQSYVTDTPHHEPIGAGRETDTIILAALELTPAARGLFVLTRTAEAAGLSLADLRGPDRSPAVVAVRDDAIWRLRRLGWSLPRIGRFIFRHHTTVMEALARRERRVSDVQV